MGLRSVHIVAVAHFLSPESFGVMAAAMFVIEFGRLFGELGLSEALIQRQEATKGEQSSLYWINISAVTMVCLLIVVLAEPISLLTKMPQLLSLLRVGSLALIVTGMSTQFQALLRKDMRFRELALANTIGPIVGLSLSLVLAIVEQNGAWPLIWGALTEALVRSVILGIYARSYGYWPSIRMHWAEAKQYLGFGARRSGGLIADFLNSRADQAAIALTMGASSLGIYNVASSFTFPVSGRLNAILATVAFPAFSKIQDDQGMLRIGYLHMLKLITTINVPIFLGLMVVSPLAIPLLLGNRWAAAAPVVQVLCLVTLVRSLIYPIGSLIIAKGYAHWSLYWNVGTLLIVPAVVFVLSKTGNMVMISLGMLAITCALFVLSYLLMLRRLLGPCLGAVLGALRSPILAGLMMALSVSGAKIFAGNTMGDLVSLTALAAGAYVGAFLLVDRAYLKQVLAQVRSTR